MSKAKAGEIAVVEAEPTFLVVPATGEVIERDDPKACASALDEIRELEWKLKEAKRWLTEALVEESGRVGTKTLHLDGMTVTLTAGSVTSYDVTELVKLLDAGLPPDRYAALVTEEVTYKVNANVAKQIAGANPAYAEIIERSKEILPKPVSASVKKA